MNPSADLLTGTRRSLRETMIPRSPKEERNVDTLLFFFLIKKTKFFEILYSIFTIQNAKPLPLPSVCAHRLLRWHRSRTSQNQLDLAWINLVFLLSLSLSSQHICKLVHLLFPAPWLSETTAPPTVTSGITGADDTWQNGDDRWRGMIYIFNIFHFLHLDLPPWPLSLLSHLSKSCSSSNFQLRVPIFSLVCAIAIGI